MSFISLTQSLQHSNIALYLSFRTSILFNQRYLTRWVKLPHEITFEARMRNLPNPCSKITIVLVSENADSWSLCHMTFIDCFIATRKKIMWHKLRQLLKLSCRCRICILPGWYTDKKKPVLFIHMSIGCQMIRVSQLGIALSMWTQFFLGDIFRWSYCALCTYWVWENCTVWDGDHKATDQLSEEQYCSKEYQNYL